MDTNKPIRDDSNDLYYRRLFEYSVDLSGTEAAKLCLAIAPNNAREAIKSVARAISKTANLHGWSLTRAADFYRTKINRNSPAFWLLQSAESALGI